MYDEVIKRIDEKNNFRFISSKGKKQAVIKADSLKLSKDTLTKEVLLIKRKSVRKNNRIPCEFNKLSTLQV
jgi:hypothetical protein